MFQVSEQLDSITKPPEKLPSSNVSLLPETPLVTVNDYRSAMRMLMGSVTVILSHGENGIHGMTASATCSVSADPPMLLVCVNQGNRSKGYIAKSGKFSLNILSAEQAHIADHFASSDKSEMPKIGMMEHHAVIDGALASFVCDVQHSIDAGSHTIFVGSVRDVQNQTGEPLGYFDGAYRSASAQELAA